MFSPGDLVVCVDDANRHCWTFTPGATAIGSLDGLRRSTVYTVRSCYETQTGFVSIRLVEIIRPLRGNDHVEPGFHSSRFRPVDRNKLSIFTDMLAPQEIERARELIRLEDAVQASLTEVDEIAAAEAIERDISG